MPSRWQLALTGRLPPARPEALTGGTAGRSQCHSPVTKRGKIALIAGRRIKSRSSRRRETIECPDFDIHDLEHVRAREARRVERLAWPTRPAYQVGLQKYRRVITTADADSVHSHLNVRVLLGPAIHLQEWPSAMPTDAPTASAQR
jgi:hypothetical protein